MRGKDQPFILIAEDNPDDVVMLRRAFGHSGITTSLQVVSDGEQVVEYLSGTGKFSNASEYPLPDVLLLDLKMPRKNGFDVLRWIAEQPWLARLRVVVLTTSEELRDVNEAYRLGASSFLVKPVNFSEFRNTLTAMHEYWMSFNQSAQMTRLKRPVNPKN